MADVKRRRERLIDSERIREQRDPPPRQGIQGRHRDLPPDADGVEAGCNYNAEQVAFLQAVDAFKRQEGKRFPTLCDLLGILKGLGYRKVTGAGQAS